MTCTVRISSKNQIVIPKEAREAMHLEPGQELLVLCKPDRIVLMQKPADFVEETRGLHSEVWTEPDGETYLREERRHWED